MKLYYVFLLLLIVYTFQSEPATGQQQQFTIFNRKLEISRDTAKQLLGLLDIILDGVYLRQQYWDDKLSIAKFNFLDFQKKLAELEKDVAERKKAFEAAEAQLEKEKAFLMREMNTIREIIRKLDEYQGPNVPIDQSVECKQRCARQCEEDLISQQLNAYHEITDKVAAHTACLDACISKCK